MKATFKHMGLYDLEFTDADVVEPHEFIPAGEYNPHNVRPWYIHNAGYCLGVTFASCESDALDILADAGKLDGFKVEEAGMADYGDEEEGITRCGNASEPFDLETVDMFTLPAPAFSFAAMFMAAQAEADQKAPTDDLIGKQYTVTQKDHEGHIATVVGTCDRWPNTDMKVRCACGVQWSSSKESLTERTKAQTVGA